MKSFQHVKLIPDYNRIYYSEKAVTLAWKSGDTFILSYPMHEKNNQRVTIFDQQIGTYVYLFLSQKRTRSCIFTKLGEDDEND